MVKIRIYKLNTQKVWGNEVKIHENGGKNGKKTRKWCKCTFLDPKSAQKSI